MICILGVVAGLIGLMVVRVQRGLLPAPVRQGRRPWSPTLQASLILR